MKQKESRSVMVGGVDSEVNEFVRNARNIPSTRYLTDVFPAGICLLSSATLSCLTKRLHCTMDSQSRRTASAYINNLLLSRGLLRNGAPIEFATPGSAEGGLDATMGQVMNLVHDLILRRDVRQHSSETMI